MQLRLGVPGKRRLPDRVRAAVTGFFREWLNHRLYVWSSVNNWLPGTYEMIGHHTEVYERFRILGKRSYFSISFEQPVGILTTLMVVVLVVKGIELRLAIEDMQEVTDWEGPSYGRLWEPIYGSADSINLGKLEKVDLPRETFVYR